MSNCWKTIETVIYLHKQITYEYKSKLGQGLKIMTKTPIIGSEDCFNFYFELKAAQNLKRFTV